MVPVQFQYAGQVGLLEGILILIGVLWVAGFLRSVIYVPVIIRDQKKESDTPENPKTGRQQIDPGGDYIDYEEVK